MQTKWKNPWNPNETIKQYFDQIKHCYVMALSKPPAYTIAQMINQAYTSVQKTLYVLALLQWNNFLPKNKD